ncbi:hypothetical protein MRX96_025547 [Rhipicephalus microplus]
MTAFVRGVTTVIVSFYGRCPDDMLFRIPEHLDVTSCGLLNPHTADQPDLVAMSVVPTVRLAYNTKAPVEFLVFFIEAKVEDA